MNQGPVEIALTFLNRADSLAARNDAPEAEVQPDADDLSETQNELRLCLKEFLRK